MTTPLFLRRLLVLWCEIWNDKLHIFYFISATVKKSVPFFVIAALDKSSFYMTDTRRIILPYTCKSHGDVRLHFPSKPHLRILGRSSSTQKTTSWPRKFPLRFRTVSQSAWTESKITSNHDDLDKFRFYPERQIGVKRRTWLWNASNSAGMLPECKSPGPACSITPSVTFSFKCRAKSKDRLAMRRVELCTLQKMDK